MADETAAETAVRSPEQNYQREERVQASGDGEGEEEGIPKLSSLFPLFAVSSSNLSTLPVSADSSSNQWLSNPSFTFDLSSVPPPSSAGAAAESLPSESDDEGPDAGVEPPRATYDLVPSSPSGSSSGYERPKHEERRSRKKKRRRKDGDRDRDGGSRKSGVRAWTGADAKRAKNYYFDAHGERDNLTYGCVYRMDVARYKLHALFSGVNSQVLRSWKISTTHVDMELDRDSLDSKLKAGGRYCSSKFKVLEQNKGFKHIRIVDKTTPSMIPGEFIPLMEMHSSENGDKNGEVEESWEDELIRKTREFNKMSRDRPYDEKVWLSFAEFQEKVANSQSRKAARLQMLEKKISILEKGVELNPDNEELLLCLLKSYQVRDTTDTLMQKWWKVLTQHSDSCTLWKEFLLVCQGEFSRFKVSEIRKVYAHAIQALSSACHKQQKKKSEASTLQSSDPSLLNLERGLVDVFVSLCRFEWQAGYQELATGLFQAIMEYNLCCPSLFLSSQSKHRLFEHFWNSGAARIGEDGALGWSSWLEKDEQSRQNMVIDDSSNDTEVGGWTGWFEPSSDKKEASNDLEELEEPAIDGEMSENIDNEDIPLEDDIETLIKKLGIDVNAEPNSEIKDTKTWNRWSQEELSRDLEQWMPIRKNSVDCMKTMPFDSDANLLKEGNEQLSRVILFEDIGDYLFSLSSKESSLSLVCQFIDFYGGKISQWTCTNEASWIQRILNLETVPDAILEELRLAFDLSNKTQSSPSSFDLDSVLCNRNDVARKTSMMKFLRNAIFLCLTIFPRNLMLEEALLSAEELFMSQMNSSACSVNPSRVLAKGLLKKDRQDILLCGVYARSEAAYGNIDMARKIFDMALTSTDALPADLRENVRLLYLWYAEMEITSGASINPELSSQRAVHILSCLGANVNYTPFNCQLAALQILRARQGFKEQVKNLRSTLARGAIEEHSIALICSASLFELLTNNLSSSTQGLEEAFSMALPERRISNLQLESLWNYYLKVLEKQLKQLKLSRLWKIIEEGLRMYPHNPKIYRMMIEVSYLYCVPSKVRLMFDESSQRKKNNADIEKEKLHQGLSFTWECGSSYRVVNLQLDKWVIKYGYTAMYIRSYPSEVRRWLVPGTTSLVMWLFALSFEFGKADSRHRIHSMFEKALSNYQLQKSVLLWRIYLSYEADVACNHSAAKRVFFRAIHACPWSKRLWLDGFQKLSSIMSAKELSDLQEVMLDKELNLRTDIYEILLQDEVVT